MTTGCSQLNQKRDIRDRSVLHLQSALFVRWEKVYNIDSISIIQRRSFERKGGDWWAGENKMATVVGFWWMRGRQMYGWWERMFLWERESDIGRCKGDESRGDQNVLKIETHIRKMIKYIVYESGYYSLNELQAIKPRQLSFAGVGACVRVCRGVHKGGG